MFKHYLIIALRNLVKNKINSAIKIIGLGLGLAASMVVLLVNYSEMTWDSFWPEAEQILLVRSESEIYGRQGFSDSLDELFFPLISQNLKQDVWVTKLGTANLSVMISNGADIQPRVEKSLVNRVSPDFVSIFNPQVLAGDIDPFHNKPDVAFISQVTAQKLFGKEDPLGKTLLIPDAVAPEEQPGALSKVKPFVIIAVVDIGNSRSHIPFGIYIPELDSQLPSMNSRRFHLPTYIKIKNNTSRDSITAKLNALPEQIPPEFDSVRSKDSPLFHLMPITERHVNDNDSQGILLRIFVLYCLGALILLVAISNFINLSLAGYVTRQKEVALRRIQGASIAQLFRQYWLENSVFIILAALGALILCELLIPYFSGLLNLHLVSGMFVEPQLAFACVVLLLLISAIVALYPAIYFAKIKPAQILRANRSTETRFSHYTRSTLLLIQFVGVGVLVIALGAITLQMRIQDNYAPGYKTENIVFFVNQQETDMSLTKVNSIKQEIKKSPNVISSSLSMDVIPGQNNLQMEVERVIQEQPYTAQLMFSWLFDLDYFSTFGMPIIAGSIPAGRPLTPPENVSNAQFNGKVVLCRTTARQLGFETPEAAINDTVGLFRQPGRQGTTPAKIIAVVEDVDLGDHRHAPKPCMFITLDDAQPNVHLAVSFHKAPSAHEIDNIKRIWQEITGVNPHHWLLSGSLADRYAIERTVQKFLYGFASVALVIGLLGIYGITALSAQKRNKEIALRKLHGAGQWQIIRLLNREFSIWVVLANLLAWPTAGFLVIRWVENFHQHFSVWLWLPILCAFALVVSLLLVWVTVTAHSLLVGKMRPAEVLRDE